MRHVLSFEHPGGEWGGIWQYQVVELETLGAVQLWYQEPGQKWALGHEKYIPAQESAHRVAEWMHGFITGQIDYETYNQLLPR